MCCHSNQPKQSMHQCHGGPAHNPLLWSKKKKKKMLEHYKECLSKQLEDVEEAIREIDEKK